MKKGIIAVLFLLLMLFILTIHTNTAHADEIGRVVMFFIDRISLEDIKEANTENLDYLLSRAGTGLVITNTGGTRSQRDTYLTIGAGAGAIGSDKSTISLNTNEVYQGKRAGDIYKQITGEESSELATVNIGIVQTIRNNISKPYTVKIGALGSVLMQAGLTPAVVGNCDTPNEHKRYISSLLMNDEGIVPIGFIDNSYLASDNNRPFGMKTDYDILYDYVEKALEDSHVIAIQLGDTSRAEDFRYEATNQMNKYYKALALEESDAFIGRVLNELILDEDLVMVITALAPSKELAINSRLTPIIIAGKGYGRGHLTSASTKREGVVTGHDISATVLNFYNIKKQHGQNGAVISSTNNEKGFEELAILNNRYVEIFNQRGFLLRSYVSAQIVFLLTALFIVIFKRKYLSLVYVGVFFLMSIPISYLILTLFHHTYLAVTFVLSWLIAALIATALYFMSKDTIYKIIIISLATVGLILIDQITGANLIKGSPLGYDTISGARFYGIGNEYMGILIGAACTGCGALLEKTRQYKKSILLSGLVFLISMFTIAILAYPGANVGGTISAGISFASLFVLSKKSKITLKNAIYIVVFALSIVLFAFFIDSKKAIDSQSHIGQTINIVRQNGLYEFINIVNRKISMNIRLFRYTIWTRVFILSLLTMVTLVFRPVGVVKEVSRRFPMVIKGLASGIIGSIVALLTNDSGIVAAATTMIFVALPFILLVCDCLKNHGYHSSSGDTS